MGDILTDSEIDAVLAAVRGRMHGNGKRYRSAVRDELILRLMLFGGLRVSEVVSLRPCDVSIAPVNQTDLLRPSTSLRRSGPAARYLSTVVTPSSSRTRSSRSSGAPHHRRATTP
jgi:integrase